jgi:two-component system alkaline phosphatase synthesis response regulator PhoP
MSHRILLVDDEPDIIELVQYNLEKEGFVVATATNGQEALKTALDFRPDLVLLDVMMPEMDGMETCAVLRTMPQMQHAVIAFLTARGEDYSQIAGFDAGGDDYINKPIKPRVLISRIKALLRRKEKGDSAAAQYESHRLKIDPNRFTVTLDGAELTLPKKEFQLLSLLASRPGRVFTRELILLTIWGSEVVVGDRTIDVHVRKLREKMGDHFIRTVKGVGYKFEDA